MKRRFALPARVARVARVAFVLAAAAAAAHRAPAAEAPAVLFPAAFSVTHELVQTDPTGETFRAQPVVDTYGNSTLVSVRPGGSRVIVDFAKRTVTEVSVEKSTYWTLSFSQMGELSRRLAKAEERPSSTSSRVPNAGPAEAIRVEEIRDDGRERPAAPVGPAPRASTRHFRASVASGAVADVWVDGTVRLSPAALDALEAFEKDALGSAAAPAASPVRLAGAARRAGGAVPVRVRRALSVSGGVTEDVVTALVPLAAFPQKLLAIGDGFRRVPSPLEGMVAFAEDEASRDSSRLVK